MIPDTGLVVARFVSLALLLAMAGIPFYLLTSGRAVLARPVRGALALLAAASMIANLWWAAASVAGMAAMPVSALDRETLQAVLEATPLGNVLAARLIAAACFLGVLALTARALPVMLIALAALASSAWTGHSGAAEGAAGIIQRLLDVVHLGAASLWLGALLVFVVSAIARFDRRGLIRNLTAFSGTGTVVVCVLALTGTANAILIGRAGWSPVSGWSLLLAAKLTLFAAMLGFAAMNRWRLTPAFERALPGAERRLVWSLTLESACALAIVALVAILGMLDPSGA